MAKEPLKTTPEHEKLGLALTEAMRPFEVAGMPHIEIIAVMCVRVGQMLAYLEPSQYKPNDVMEMIARNIELGNAAAVTYAAMHRKKDE